MTRFESSTEAAGIEFISENFDEQITENCHPTVTPADGVMLCTSQRPRPGSCCTVNKSGRYIFSDLNIRPEKIENGRRIISVSVTSPSWL